MSKKWTADQMPDLNGKVVVVTGGNSGLGFESVKALLKKNAEVIMGCRNMEKGKKAVDEIKAEQPQAKVELMQLDLSSLDSVKKFVGAFEEKYPSLDILMNNAGIMAVAESKTAEGFESQFGVNHLGHFVLTALLMDKLESAEAGRVVNVASLAATNGKIDFDNLMGEKGYSKFGAYAQSKLANVLFTQELNERLENQGFKTRSIAAHPGGSNTNLGEAADFGPVMRFIGRIVLEVFMQPASRGALPQLYAATDPKAEAGNYYGPDGFGEMSGYPKVAKHPESAKDRDAQKKLWDVSEQLTQVSFLSE